jgi:hypothetical protein
LGHKVARTAVRVHAPVGGAELLLRVADRGHHRRQARGPLCNGDGWI